MNGNNTLGVSEIARSPFHIALGLTQHLYQQQRILFQAEAKARTSYVALTRKTGSLQRSIQKGQQGCCFVGIPEAGSYSNWT